MRKISGKGRNRLGATLVVFYALVALYILLFVPVARGDALSDIVGPVTAVNTSPWPWYDKAEIGNLNEIYNAAVANEPAVGAAAAGTFALANGCNITLTGAGASEFNPGDLAIVAWTAPNGAGTGRYVFAIKTIVGTVMTDNTSCGFPPGMVAESGLTVYHCPALTCSSDSTDHHYSPGLWGLDSSDGSQSWNYYDFGMALYRYYLRSGDASWLTKFRTFTDEWFLWAINQGTQSAQGGSNGFRPRSSSMVSQFVRALDMGGAGAGGEARLKNFYAVLKSMYDGNNFSQYDGLDDREPGYIMMFMAVGAKADSDPTRHASYCTMLANQVAGWNTYQQTQGFWPEKNFQFPYTTLGESPWRAFAPLQAMERAYDVLNDVGPTGCNNRTLAASSLPTIKNSIDWIHNYGYSVDPGNRGVFYDAMYPNNGEILNSGAGTVSVPLMGSNTTVTGVGTNFTVDFAPCNGTTWIGITLNGISWTHKVTACANNTHLTIATAWGTQCIPRVAGTLCAPTDAVADGYYFTGSAFTTCGNSAPFCWSFDGMGSMFLKGDRNNDRDLPWVTGWYFKTTGNITYKTWADEYFSASYGGPAGGPGFNFPGSPGPCGGPGCDGVQTDYMLALHGCGISPTLPCNPDTNFPDGNVYHAWAKRFAQGSGIGGGDNWLFWRLLGNSPSSSISGQVTMAGRSTLK